MDVLDTKGKKLLLYYISDQREVFKVVETIGKKDHVKKDNELINIVDLSSENNTMKLIYLH